VEKRKLLNLMRYWLLGTFLIVFTATTVYSGLFTNKDWVSALKLSYPVWGFTAILCVAWYLLYKLYIRTKP
jgi:hypothetical protein